MLLENNQYCLRMLLERVFEAPERINRPEEASWLGSEEAMVWVLRRLWFAFHGLMTRSNFTMDATAGYGCQGLGEWPKES